ncbi:uncharacterized protein LOC116348325 [Contarinia nasturtii]|uniref:uncharacterized protein LOC116348325 n=1 Tax=Contarinia nasturtii TaxID=265458 RepID=UPI0012D3E55A|nr:uncharacterized protein LOC116348325 [Contarinia nasturtii]
MKTILFIALIAASTFAAPSNDSKMSKEQKQFYEECLEKSGLPETDAKSFRNKSPDAILSGKEQKFVCCVSEPMIKNGELDMEIVKGIVKQHGNRNIDVNSAVKSCESKGFNSSNLESSGPSCAHTAQFAHCVFSNLRKSNEDNKSY